MAKRKYSPQRIPDYPNSLKGTQPALEELDRLGGFFSLLLQIDRRENVIKRKENEKSA